MDMPAPEFMYIQRRQVAGGLVRGYLTGTTRRRQARARRACVRGILSFVDERSEHNDIRPANVPSWRHLPIPDPRAPRPYADVARTPHSTPCPVPDTWMVARRPRSRAPRLPCVQRVSPSGQRRQDSARCAHTHTHAPAHQERPRPSYFRRGAHAPRGGEALVLSVDGKDGAADGMADNAGEDDSGGEPPPQRREGEQRAGGWAMIDAHVGAYQRLRRGPEGRTGCAAMTATGSGSGAGKT